MHQSKRIIAGDVVDLRCGATVKIRDITSLGVAVYVNGEPSRGNFVAIGDSLAIEDHAFTVYFNREAVKPLILLLKRIEKSISQLAAWED